MLFLTKHVPNFCSQRSFEGRSGIVQFDQTGRRSGLTFEVQEVGMYRGLTTVSYG